MLLLQLHAPSTALLIREAAARGIAIPIVAGSALHQPATAALLEPQELKGVCAESGSAPAAEEGAAITPLVAFTARYQAEFGGEAPDAYALAQYDAVNMALAGIRAGHTTPTALRDYLATARYDGLAMTYQSDGKGNMAYSAVILCYDGQSRIPHIIERYDLRPDLAGAPAASAP